MSSFKDLRIVDNFYQTSLFFPMPAVLVSTLTDDGKTTCGPYSLIQPFYVAGKEYYAMMLCCRNSSNTAQNLIKHKKCVINFLPDDRASFKEMVRLGWPGDTPEEKMKDFKFHLEDGLRAKEDPSGVYPKVITEAVQAMECTWVDTLDNAQDDKPIEPGKDHYELEKYHDFNGITTPYGAHFVLKVDHILMKERYYNAIINGVKRSDFPPLPVDYGYRDSKNFWYHKHRRLIPELLPMRQTTVASVRYAADRIDPTVKFTDEALARLVNVPRIFLPTALKGCIKWAKENGVTTITEKEMDIINDKRAKEKNK
ncbi:MAG: flavin reductase [Erysipelotrichales bacterium]|nr:flavin reductase [Erysipelotrichales bacterium]MBQ2310064.1 flavin reductase [Erysipelotrichales bacterium]